MMGSPPELSALKDIPGYKAILKTVLKSQIQLLLEQLAENTGEESIILTASINDGSLSHLGSSMGKNFLDGREEIKSQFLGFCLKGHQQMRRDEDRNQMFGRSNITNMPQYGTRRPRIRPHPYSASSPHSQSSLNNRSNLQDFSSATPPFLKTEDGSVNSADNFLDSVSGDMQDDQMGLQASVNLNHTQPSSQDRKNELNQSGLSTEKEYQSASSDIPIKIEPVSDDLEDEVRIIESEENSASSETWGQGDPNETDQSRFNWEPDIEHKLSQSYREPEHESSENDFSGLQCATKSDNNMEQMAESDTCITETRFLEVTTVVNNKEVQTPVSYRKVLTCKICQRTFWFKSHMFQHLKMHTNEKMHQCHRCEKSFKHKHHLLRHIRENHTK